MVLKRFTSVLLVGSLVLLSGCSSQTAETSETAATAEATDERPTAVTVQKATVGNIENTVSFSGRTAITKETSATAQTAGKVEKVYVSEGDYVQKGAVLLTINGDDLNNTIKQSAASLASAQLAYEKSLDSGSIDSQISQLETAVNNAQIAYDEALRTYNDNKEFYDSGIITSNALTQSEVALKQAKQQLESAQKSLDITKNKTIPDSQDSAKAQVQTAQVAYDTAVSNLDKLTITAPASGLIKTANFKEGELISQSAPAFVISNMNSMVVELSVTEADLSRFSIGQSLNVTIDGKDVAGKVSELPNESDTSGTLFTVKVAIDNSSNAFIAGMSADAVLTSEKSDSVVLIPKKALLQEEDNSYYVYICDANNIAVKTPVTLGISNADTVAIKSGVTKDDTVVVGGLSLITEGSSLYPVEVED